jgi:hypothetical protein
VNKPELRSSQVITTFGPGAMVDFPDASIMVAGLDNWRYDSTQIPTIDEPRLVNKLRALLGVSDLTLRAPPPAAEQDYGFQPAVDGWRFPEWFIVQEVVMTPKGFRRRQLVNLAALDGGKYKDRDKKKRPVVPIRFVRACRKGHIGDIDWKAFVHGDAGECARDLWLEERGTSGDLDEILVVCECGAERPMSLAARMDQRALGKCNGSRPWLGSGTREKCGEPNRLLIRSASNAYFPQLMSVISIPDTQKKLDEIVRSLWADFLSEVESIEDVVKVLRKPTPRDRLEGYTKDQVWASIQRVRAGENSTERPVKEVEFEALADARDETGADEPDGDFYTRALPVEKWKQSTPWMAPIQRVVMVHRLRVVAAQVGFTRFEAAGPDIQGDLSMDVQMAALAVDARWLPAVEHRGEGIFLLFDPHAVKEWLARPQVKERGRRLDAGFDLWKKDHSESKREFAGLPYYMLHSFSHLLLTAIALECGYPACSLSERVYATPDEGYGVLIYTASSDAEGTLGGLVEAGRRIKQHVQRALELGSLCSNDPVCANHMPAPHDAQPLIGSACHGCLLIAETSCEMHNNFLDRSLVVQTVEALGAEFFGDAP